MKRGSSGMSEFSKASKASRFSSLLWMFFVFRRMFFFARVGNSRSLLYLSISGVATGVFVLICVISVMNGLQLGYIESVLEINSYHIQIDGMDEDDFASLIRYAGKNIRDIIPFRDIEVLISGIFSHALPFRIRALDPERVGSDFFRHIHMLQGSFNIKEGMVLPHRFAYENGILVGEMVDVMSFPVNPREALRTETIRVTGLFEGIREDESGGMGYISLEYAERLAGLAIPTLGIKLHKRNNVQQSMSDLGRDFPLVRLRSWRELNWGLFGALLVEKFAIVILLGLIFIVVGTNVFQSFRRNVIQRSRDIAILHFLGGRIQEVRAIFICAGFVAGIIGSFLGLVLGLLISLNIEILLQILQDLSLYLRNIFFSQGMANSIWSLDVHAIITYSDVFIVVFFAISSIVISAYHAARRVQDTMILQV